MTELGRTRRCCRGAWLFAGPLLACWAILCAGAVPARAQEGEPPDNSIRVQKGAHGLGRAYPIVSGEVSTPCIVILRGTRSVSYLKQGEDAKAAPAPAKGAVVASSPTRPVALSEPPRLGVVRQLLSVSGAPSPRGERLVPVQHLELAIPQPLVPGFRQLDVQPIAQAIPASPATPARRADASAPAKAAPPGREKEHRPQRDAQAPATAAGRQPLAVSPPSALPQAVTAELHSDRQERQDASAVEASAYRTALLNFVSNLAALLVSLPVFCVAVYILLRKFRFVLPAVAPAEARWEPAPQPGGLTQQPADGPVDPARQFDMGPSYEEERQLREEAARQQEQAVLQHLYEQNLRLREQIGELATAGE
jgi:hypothetical protein